MSLEPGTQFAGYTIVRRIGAGGMGTVYLAEHPRLPRFDVIKVLAEHVSNDPTFRARFTREADLAAQLDHPCVVSVYDRGEVDGLLWISMQYVPGTDAAELLEANPGGLPVDDAVAVGDSIGAALDHAHRHGLLHRDVKPANILISSPQTTVPGARGTDDERRIRLADFGIARQTDGGTALTSANLVIGSFPYSSPEQLSAEPLDARSDVYSLACTVFELLTGTVPFTARTPMMMIHHHLSTPPPDAAALRRGLPRGVSDAIRHGLAKRPDDRPSTAGAFAAELRAAAAATGYLPAPSGLLAAGAAPPVTETLRARSPVTPPTQVARTEQVPTAPASRPTTVHRPPTPAGPVGFPTATAYSALPGHSGGVADPGSTMIRASGDLPLGGLPSGAHPSSTRPASAHPTSARPTGAEAARLTTASLACGIAAVPLSIVGGFGLPVGVAGWYLAGRGRHSSAAVLARTLCVVGMILSLGILCFAIGRAEALQF
ncbi:serine/threonine-protein kinase [Gordonia aurantiaca]|uniref:serine/threonine-protein kinase n=1 Tax=Gordonia sp. B21 TaxID=3151852 RepID=UPI003264AE79